jgi:phage-related baseplate assembly protein
MTSAIQLSKLPPPDVVEALDFEVLYDQAKAKLVEVWPSFTADLESEPANKILQVLAYIAMGLRQRVNDAARACFLATAKKNDLDNLGALLGVKRLTIVEAKPELDVPAVMEEDDDFRERITLAPASFSVAGPADAYIFHARSASGDVLDASATSPKPDDIKALVAAVLAAHNATADLVNDMAATLDAAKWPGDVSVTVLSRNGDGTAPKALLDTVAATVSADNVRPLTDNVTVRSAEIIPYDLVATLYTFAGPDAEIALEASQKSMAKFQAASRRLGRSHTLSGLYAALQVEGIQDVELASPAGSVLVDKTQAAYCRSITLKYGGIGD